LKIRLWILIGFHEWLLMRKIAVGSGKQALWKTRREI
jgi:hypothetical protein